MKLKLKVMELTSFKGVKHKVIKFDGDVIKIIGQNGSGKSTIATAFMWVMCDSDYNLNKNPEVIPLGDTECRPTVKLWLDIDGKEITVQKEQIVKVKNVDDKVQTNITNSYSINDVEKKYSDFVFDLKERGIDMDHFLILSNPNAFMADTSKKGRDEMRKILFEMTEAISDLDIAKELGYAELSALLENYKLDEISAMNKSTVRKIIEKNGRNNEIIEANIRGVLDSKSSYDVQELLKTKVAYEEELKEINSTADMLLKGDQEIKGKIAELEGQLLEIERSEKRILEEKIANASERYRMAEKALNDIEISELNCQVDVNRAYADREGVNESLENYRNLYKKVLGEVFDEECTVCPSCGRAFPKEQVEEMKKSFEDGKTKRMDDYKSKGEVFARQLEKLNKAYEDAKTKHENAHKMWKSQDEKVSKLKEELMSIPRTPNLLENEEYVSIQTQLESLRTELQNGAEASIKQQVSRLNELVDFIKDVDNKLAVVERDKELDEKVNKLREQRKKDEVEKARAEKILSQVESLEMAKNNRLTDEINKNFKIVNFRLFKTLKNGNIEPALDVLYEGKELTSSVNGSHITLCKLDIIDGLSKHYNQILPVFIDDAALITSNVNEKIDMKNQLIQLVAQNGVTELQIERG